MIKFDFQVFLSFAKWLEKIDTITIFIAVPLHLEAVELNSSVMLQSPITNSDNPLTSDT